MNKILSGAVLFVFCFSFSAFAKPGKGNNAVVAVKENEGTQSRVQEMKNGVLD